MVISVKSDKTVSIAYLRDLIGTMTNNKADMAGLICYTKPSDGIYAEAMRAGYYELDSDLFRDMRFPKVQMLTAEELLSGKKFDIPPLRIGKQ